MAIIYSLGLFWLNFKRIDDNNFWSDEVFSIKLVRLGVTGMLQGTANDVHPPLYYLILMGFRSLFGESYKLFHWVSLVPFAVVLVFLLTTIWDRFGKEVVFLMITFCSLMPSAVRYNVEARMYSLSFMFVLSAFYGLYRIMTEGKRSDYIFFVINSLGAAYSHYYAMISVAFFYLALLVNVFRKKMSLKTLIKVYLATILGYMPWMIQMIMTFGKTAKSFWMTDYSSVKESLFFLFKVYPDLYSWAMLTLTGVMLVALLIYAFASRISVLEYAFGKKNDEDLQLKEEALWLVWGVVAVGGTIAVGELISILIQPSYSIRYLYPVVGVIWLVLCVSLSKLRWKFPVCIVIFLVSLRLMYSVYNYTCYVDGVEKELFENTYSAMQENISDEDVILTDYLHYNLTILDYYFPNNKHMLIRTDFSDFNDKDNYWFMTTASISDEFLEMFENNGFEVNEKITEGNLGTYSLYLYELVRR